ncbi:MAG: hypothetical protein R2736_00335 [Solirubrobacterales bacterium]
MSGISAVPMCRETSISTAGSPRSLTISGWAVSASVEVITSDAWAAIAGPLAPSASSPAKRFHGAAEVRRPRDLAFLRASSRRLGVAFSVLSAIR